MGNERSQNCGSNGDTTTSARVFPTHFTPTNSFVFHVFVSLFSKTGYKAPSLEPQDHARMKDLKMPVLMVALKPLHDYSRPISCQKLVFSHVVFTVFEKETIKHRSWRPRTI